MFNLYLFSCPRHRLELPTLRNNVRKTNGVLTILLKMHHPGLVEQKGKLVFASTWEHYKRTPTDGGRPKAEEIDEEFCVTNLVPF